VRQLVISSGAVTKPASPVHLFLNIFGKIMEEKNQEKTQFENCAGFTNANGLSYTDCDPGGLLKKSRLEVQQVRTQSRRYKLALPVAAFICQARTVGATLECYNADTGAPLALVSTTSSN
jgi:hypothetical protein